MSDDLKVFRFEPFGQAAIDHGNRHTGLSNRANGLAAASSYFADRTFDRKLNELLQSDRIARDIATALKNSPGAGVLVVIGYLESPSPGGSHRTNLSVIVAGSASKPSTAIERWKTVPKLMAAPPNGRYRRVEEYRWLSSEGMKEVIYVPRTSQCFKPVETGTLPFRD